MPSAKFWNGGTVRHQQEQDGRRTHYAGAIYGSLLAASVIAGAGAYAPAPRLGLVVLILATGIVFWVVHVYVHLAGERVPGQPLTWAEVRGVARHEWPMVQAAVPPVVAVAISSLLDLGLAETAWFALGVALAEQVAWATVAAARAGASRRGTALSGLVNLVLGLIIVAAKTAVHR